METTEYEQKFMSTCMNGFVALEIALGHKVGLFEELRNLDKPVSSTELAKNCKLKERYVKEWLGSMSAAQFVSITDDDKYFIPEACKPYTHQSHLACLVPLVSNNMTQVIECFQEDGPKGFDYAKQFDKVQWLGEGHKNCDAKWIDDNIYPTGLKDKESMLNILDIGCGMGNLTLKIAKYFPSAMVCGIDILEEGIVTANANKEEQNVQNVEFVHCKAEDMEHAWDNKFDWIVMSDVLHDLPDPDSCITAIKRVLKDDGIVSAVDPLCHSDQKLNVGNPRASMVYVFGTFVCLPCSMSAEPAAGLGIGWGLENRAKFLQSNGFETFEGSDKSIVHFRKKKE